MNRNRFSFLITIAIAACSDNTADPGTATLPSITTTNITTNITTSGGTVTTSDDPTSTTGSDDTATMTDSSTTSTSTSSSTTTSTTLTTSTTDPNDYDCLPPPPTPEMPNPYMCSQAPEVVDFCSYLAESCAAHEIEPIYCEILVDKCNDPIRCTACFYLANTCAQIGIDCEDLGYECGCVADGQGGTTGATETTTGDLTTGGALEEVWCGLEGGLFGPCFQNNCTPPFACNNTNGGAMCVPSKAWRDNHAEEVEVCNAQVGGVIDCETLPSWCQIDCSFDQSSCVLPAQCDQYAQICVYPY